MSYSFHIGEGKWNSKEKMNCVSIHAEDDAPVIEGDHRTENRNERHPGYRTWDEFCEATGLHDLFFRDKDRLIQEHPGSVRLNLRHLKVIREAVERFKKVQGNARPRFCSCSSEEYCECGTTHADAHYARLIWLLWWIHWALRNCRNPTFQNY